MELARKDNKGWNCAHSRVNPFDRCGPLPVAWLYDDSSCTRLNHGDYRESYGILDNDVYNFVKTGFTMGVAATSKVVTSSDTLGRAVDVQPGNCDWVTTIEGINAPGWSIPPFVILSEKLD